MRHLKTLENAPRHTLHNSCLATAEDELSFHVFEAFSFGIAIVSCITGQRTFFGSDLLLCRTVICNVSSRVVWQSALVSLVSKIAISASSKEALTASMESRRKLVPKGRHRMLSTLSDRSRPSSLLNMVGLSNPGQPLGSRYPIGCTMHVGVLLLPQLIHLAAIIMISHKHINRPRPRQASIQIARFGQVVRSKTAENSLAMCQSVLNDQAPRRFFASRTCMLRLHEPCQIKLRPIKQKPRESKVNNETKWFSSAIVRVGPHMWFC